MQRLSHRRSDLERLCGFSSSKFTGVNYFFTLIAGCLFFFLFYGVLVCFRDGECIWIEMFFHGGPGKRSFIPYFTVFFGCWSLVILGVKMQKLSVQKKALKLAILPDDPNFVLTCATAQNILERIDLLVEDPKRFLLLDRISRALVNLKNVEDVSALAECLTTQQDNDDSYLASTYTVLKGFVWAIPVLGFIGTVLGLSEAVGGFGKVVKEGGSDINLLIAELGNVTGGLSIAFETTFIALVLALIIQIVMTAVLSREEMFLDACSDYCHKNLISKARSVAVSENGN